HRVGAREELSVGSSLVYPKSSHVQRSGDRHQPTSQQSSHRSHSQNNDRHGSDRRGGSDTHRSSNHNSSGRIPVMDVTKETGVISPTDPPILRFLRLAGFLGAAAGTAEEQVANAARNYEILHERDDDTERPDKRQKSGDRHQPTTQQSSHRNHGHDNDRHGSDSQGGGDNHRSSSNYSGNNRNSGNGRDQRNRGPQSNRPVNSGNALFQQSKGPSEGYSYPVCTTCGRRHLGECRQAAGTCFKYGQTGYLQKDCKKNTAASTSGQADKKPGASGRVFAITEDHATKTSGTITGTLYLSTCSVCAI
nr:hypothetical protein [Tanacetum cinerariifolium]